MMQSPNATIQISLPLPFFLLVVVVFCAFLFLLLFSSTAVPANPMSSSQETTTGSVTTGQVRPKPQRPPPQSPGTSPAIVKTESSSSSSPSSAAVPLSSPEMRTGNLPASSSSNPVPGRTSKDPEGAGGERRQGKGKRAEEPLPSVLLPQETNRQWTGASVGNPPLVDPTFVQHGPAYQFAAAGGATPYFPFPPPPIFIFWGGRYIRMVPEQPLQYPPQAIQQGEIHHPHQGASTSPRPLFPENPRPTIPVNYSSGIVDLNDLSSPEEEGCSPYIVTFYSTAWGNRNRISFLSNNVDATLTFLQLFLFDFEAFKHTMPTNYKDVSENHKQAGALLRRLDIYNDAFRTLESNAMFLCAVAYFFHLKSHPGKHPYMKNLRAPLDKSIKVQAPRPWGSENRQLADGSMVRTTNALVNGFVEARKWLADGHSEVPVVFDASMRLFYLP